MKFCSYMHMYQLQWVWLPNLVSQPQTFQLTWNCRVINARYVVANGNQWDILWSFPDNLPKALHVLGLYPLGKPCN